MKQCRLDHTVQCHDPSLHLAPGRQIGEPLDTDVGHHTQYPFAHFALETVHNGQYRQQHGDSEGETEYGKAGQKA